MACLGSWDVGRGREHAARRRAMATPMPRVAPVTIARALLRTRSSRTASRHHELADPAAGDVLVEGYRYILETEDGRGLRR